MTEIRRTEHRPIYHEDRVLTSIDVEINAETNDQDQDDRVLEMVDRINETVESELQAIQDEIDDAE